MGVFMGPIRTESARSLGGARVITADYKFVLKKFRDDPSFAFQIINTMAQRDRTRTEEQEKTVEGLNLQQEELTARNRELKDAGQAAEESRDKNADYYDFAPVGAIDLDEDGIIRGINLSGTAMLGAERQDLLGLSLRFLRSHGKPGCVPEPSSGVQALFRRGDHRVVAQHREGGSDKGADLQLPETGSGPGGLPDVDDGTLLTAAGGRETGKKLIPHFSLSNISPEYFLLQSGQIPCENSASECWPR